MNQSEITYEVNERLKRTDKLHEALTYDEIDIDSIVEEVMCISLEWAKLLAEIKNVQKEKANN